jgi:hypothetical protein
MGGRADSQGFKGKEAAAKGIGIARHLQDIVHLEAI